MVTLELLDFIRSERVRGVSDEAIAQTLQQTGWSMEDVRAGFSTMEQTSVPPPAPPPEQNSLQEASSSASPGNISIRLLFQSKPFLILLVSAILVLVGTVVWVMYSVPQIFKQTTTAQQLAASSTPIDNGHIDCQENDLACLIAAAQNCSPATMESPQTIGTTTVQLQFSLNGLNPDGTCSLYETPVPSSWKIICTSSPNNIAQSITAWGQTGDINAIANSLANGLDCEYLLPDGTKVPLNTGGTPTTTSQTQPSPPKTVSGSTGSPKKTTLATTPAPSAPSGVGTATTNLAPNENYSDGNNNLKITVGTVSATTLNMTVTNTVIGKSATVSLTINKPTLVLNYDMMVTSITQIYQGMVSGQSLYAYQATISYK